MPPLDQARIVSVVQARVIEHFEFGAAFPVDAVPLAAGGWAVCYGNRAYRPELKLGFDLNLDGDVCWLLNIDLPEFLRGKGHGWALYQAVHASAADLGCRVVRQTPSGGRIVDGKLIRSRRDYLLARGYRPYGDWEVELDLASISENRS